MADGGQCQNLHWWVFSWGPVQMQEQLKGLGWGPWCPEPGARHFSRPWGGLWGQESMVVK